MPNTKEDEHHSILN